MFELSAELFIRNICSHPGDNLAVGIYADWLEEQGSPEAVRVQNFYRGTPLADDFYELAKQLSPEQQVICAILLAKDVLSVYEDAYPDDPAPRRAIAAAEKGEVTQEILDDAWDAWVAWVAVNTADAAADDAAYTAYYAAYTAYYVARAVNAAYYVARAVDYALRVKPERREAYLMIMSSFILFGCNAIVLE